MKEKATAVSDETKVTEAAAEKETTADVPETKKTIETAAVPTAEKKEEKAKPAAKRGPKPGAKRAAKEDAKPETKKAVKEELKPEVFIQFQNKEAVVEDAIAKAKGQFVADGHRMSTIKSLQIYLKPEEGAAYYVINRKFAGRVDLF